MTVHGLLANSRAHFYHATCLRGLAAYCKSGAILSRKCWIEADPGYTVFWSDKSDEQIGVLTRVFGNVYDFGAIFARANFNSSPNVYGPITLEFSQGVFCAMADIVLTKESVGTMSQPQKWKENALTVEQVQEMLKGDDFGHPIAKEYHYTELSCGNSVLGLSDLAKVTVEPIQIGPWDLVSKVRELAKAANIADLVEPRSYKSDKRKDDYQKLATAMWELSKHEKRREITLEDLPDWVKKEKLCSRFVLWANYFFNGTACFLRESA